jgi:hypothetical protein
MFPEEADLEAYEAVVDATAEYMAAAGDEVRRGVGLRAADGGGRLGGGRRRNFDFAAILMP